MLNGLKQAIGRGARRIAEGFLGLSFASVDPDYEPGYRRLTGRGGRDLDPLSQEQMLRVCRFLYDSNPLASWIVDQRVDLVLGDELGYSVEVDGTALTLDATAKAALEAAIKTALDRFWDHPAFSIRFRADELLTSFMVDGELCLPVAAVNAVDGIPTLDFIDAALIERVVPLNGSAIIFDRVELKVDPAAPPKSLQVIRFNPTSGRLEGECFYHRNSRLANSMRGRSELLRQADWCDALDQFLFARADRATLLNSMIWDVTLKGANEAQVLAKKAEINKHPPTKPGSYRIHNESEEWKAVTPDLGAGDATDEVKLLRNYILGSKSMPESWFSDGGEVTRTTAGEQNDVALMALRRLRKVTMMIFRSLLEFAYDQLSAKQSGKYPARSRGIALIPDLPPLAERDISRLGGVIQNIQASLDAAVQQQQISARTSRKVFLHVIDRLGVPVDPDDEVRQIDAEQKDVTLQKTEEANRLAADRLAGHLPPEDRAA